jgi:hypothetical protein
MRAVAVKVFNRCARINADCGKVHAVSYIIEDTVRIQTITKGVYIETV